MRYRRLVTRQYHAWFFIAIRWLKIYNEVLLNELSLGACGLEQKNRMLRFCIHKIMWHKTTKNDSRSSLLDALNLLFKKTGKDICRQKIFH